MKSYGFYCKTCGKLFSNEDSVTLCEIVHNLEERLVRLEVDKSDYHAFRRMMKKYQKEQNRLKKVPCFFNNEKNKRY